MSTFEDRWFAIVLWMYILGLSVAVGSMMLQAVR
jgi:hypothetical protein